MSYDCNIIYRQAKNSLRHRVLFDTYSFCASFVLFFFSRRGSRCFPDWTLKLVAARIDGGMHGLQFLMPWPLRSTLP